MGGQADEEDEVENTRNLGLGVSQVPYIPRREGNKATLILPHIRSYPALSKLPRLGESTALVLGSGEGALAGGGKLGLGQR